MTDSQIILQRTLPFPPERLFNAWTEPELLEIWWSPEEYETVVKELNLTEGGRWIFHVIDEEGDEYPISGRYQNIRPNRFLHITGDELDEEDFSIQIEFQPKESGECNVILTLSFPGPEEKEESLDSGIIEEWDDRLERLEMTLQTIH